MSIESRRERRNQRNGFKNFEPSNIEEVKFNKTKTCQKNQSFIRT